MSFLKRYKSYPKFAYASYDPALDDVEQEENPGDILYTMDKSIQTVSFLLNILYMYFKLYKLLGVMESLEWQG